MKMESAKWYRAGTGCDVTAYRTFRVRGSARECKGQRFPVQGWTRDGCNQVVNWQVQPQALTLLY